jgi:hypothetical protein
VNFTREPIIETVITPREGYKLVVRNSKGNNQEEYLVDAVEVVSFGHSFFFRSPERPKPFLVPVGDYEVFEMKEARMVLKNISTERSIKIGGGRESPPRQRENVEPPRQSEPQEEANQEQQARPPERMDRKRDKRRRGRRGRDRHEPSQQEVRERQPQVSSEENASVNEGLPQEAQTNEEAKAPSVISKLFPPPPTLIKETLSRYKSAEFAADEGFVEETTTSFEESIFEHEKLPAPQERSEEEHQEE